MRNSRRATDLTLFAFFDFLKWPNFGSWELGRGLFLHLRNVSLRRSSGILLRLLISLWSATLAGVVIFD